MQHQPLKLYATFLTIDGEVTSFPGPGQWSVFIRLGGCNLRCWKSSGYCDAPASLDASYPWPEVTPQDLVEQIAEDYPGVKKVTITGGEPLLQKDSVLELARILRKDGYKISIETSGSKLLYEPEVAEFDCVIADLKCPSTEMDKFNLPELYYNLRKTDFIKAVVQDKDDLRFVKKFVSDHPSLAQIAISPRHGFIEPVEIVEWLENKSLFNWMLNLQMHKIVWPDCVKPPLQTLKGIDIQKAISEEV